MASIADIRIDYRQKTLVEKDIAANAIDQFARWWEEAVQAAIEEVNAMTLATVMADGRPDARIVLLKGFDEKGFIFYTNYNSNKGQELAQHPHACLVFFWKELERQVRIQGAVHKVDAAMSDAYFDSRPLGSRIGALASHQSEVIADRSIIENKKAELEQMDPAQIRRPEHWGGYLVQPTSIEFWQGRSSRLHDRIKYTKERDNSWATVRLAP
jgi:pyridoxamine 5'-phosphate oxidase